MSYISMVLADADKSRNLKTNMRDDGGTFAERN